MDTLINSGIIKQEFKVPTVTRTADVITIKQSKLLVELIKDLKVFDTANSIFDNIYTYMCDWFYYMIREDDNRTLDIDNIKRDLTPLLGSDEYTLTLLGILNDMLPKVAIGDINRFWTSYKPDMIKLIGDREDIPMARDGILKITVAVLISLLPVDNLSSWFVDTNEWGTAARTPIQRIALRLGKPEEEIYYNTIIGRYKDKPVEWKKKVLTAIYNTLVDCYTYIQLP